MPRYRIGPVVQALLRLGRQRGTAELTRRLTELIRVCQYFERLEATRQRTTAADAADGPSVRDEAVADAVWWASQLTAEVLTRVPDAEPYADVLRRLVDCIGATEAQRRASSGTGPAGVAVADPAPAASRAATAAEAPGRRGDERPADHGVGTLGEEPSGSGGAGDGAAGAATAGAGAGNAAAGGAAHGDAGAGWGFAAHGPASRAGASAVSSWGDAAGAVPAAPSAAGAVPSVPGGHPVHVAQAVSSAETRWQASSPASEKAGDHHPAGEDRALRSVGRSRAFDVFGAWFWRGLALPAEARMELFRCLVVAESGRGEQRYLDGVAEWLRDEPRVVQPLLTGWFGDRRALRSAPEATVARAAQALLHTHRHGAIDDLTEALVGCAHPLGDELLGALAEDEPSAMCRAVDRWAHDERPERRVAAAAYGVRAAPRARSEADHSLLRYAALALLARPADCTLHGSALALLVRDPVSRDRYLELALTRFEAGDPQVTAGAIAAALPTHPDEVLAAFRRRLAEPGPVPGDLLRTLAGVTTHSPARRVAVLVQDFLAARPEAAGEAAAYIDAGLEQGPHARVVLHPLVSGLIRGGPVRIRAALAGVLADPGTPVSGELRGELLELLLGTEQDPVVLDVVLCVLAARRAGRSPAATCALVRRTGRLLVRTPEGAGRFDRRLVDLARGDADLARTVAQWIADAPQEWAALVGPSARRTIVNLAGAEETPAVVAGGVAGRPAVV
ncbi:hypothetical protein DY218_07245 [Streptomyces triticagri]|uniref:Uncharacterized protein n=1 Tax=Streptomyces triticagri TaxID=2293568 RepID=A0A372MAE2_9ACTN|nr:hypothetical protein DY218_07245 [Streptomyces triticagri]